MARVAALTASPEPFRVQLRRLKGWRLPPNTVVVSRPTVWGSPFAIAAARDGEEARQMYLEASLGFRGHGELMDYVRSRGWVGGFDRFTPATSLAGKNVACWCPPERTCHSNVHLALANAW